MRTLLLTVLLTILTLTTSAEEITTNNLLPNSFTASSKDNSSGLRNSLYFETGIL